MKTSLSIFIEELTAAWGPFNSETVASCRRLVEDLARNPATAHWLGEVLAPLPHSQELYRDPSTGCVLLSYIEQEGLYRTPHDHGDGWVVYAVQSGEMEMCTYHRAITPEGRLKLVRRDSYLLKPGDVQVYLPGDIHDTLCISSSATLLRFTSCDLKEEDRAGRMIRYRDFDRDLPAIRSKR